MLNQKNMAEAIGSHLDDREAIEGAEFVPEAVDRIPLPKGGFLTIIRGLVNGKPEALVFGADSPPELMMPSGDGEKIDSGLQTIRDLVEKFRKNFPKLAAGLALGGGTLAALQGCVDVDGHSYNNGNDGVRGNYSLTGMALTQADLVNLGPPQKVPWAKPGDVNVNFAKLNGKQVVLFHKELPGLDEIHYVDCNKFAECLDASKVPKKIEGLPKTSYESAIIYEDINGQGQIIFEVGELVEMNMGYSNGKLEASGQPVQVYGGYNLSQYEVGGVPHMIHSFNDTVSRNLHTGVETKLPMPGSNVSECGSPHFEGVAIGSQFEKLGGWKSCYLVTAPTLDELTTKAIKITSQNSAGNFLKNPRIHDNFVIYEADTPDGIQLYYAVVLPYCTDGTCNGTENSQSCPQDCPPVPQDAVDGTAVDGTALDGTADAVDGTAVDGTALDGTADAVDGTAVDDTADTADTTPLDKCAPIKAKVKMVKDECGFEECHDQSAILHGNCTFKVDLGGQNPITVEINGKYSVDLLNKMLAFIGGKYKVVTGGNKFTTSYGPYGTAPAGTVFGGEGPEIKPGEEPSYYNVWCSEGAISVSYNGKLVAEIKGDLSAPAKIFVDGVEKKEEVDAGPEDTSTPPEDTSTPPEDTSTPPEDTSKPTDTNAATDAVIAKPPLIKKPPSSGGCNVNLHGENSGAALAVVGGALAGLLASRRKEEDEDV